MNKSQLFTKHHFIHRNIPFTIGDLKITPYWMDHSAFDSYAFLIEGDGKRVLYSGDFRGHGRKTKTFKDLLANPPREVDYLLLEGTNIGRKSGDENSEEDLQVEFETVFTEEKLNLVMTSAQNIDRMVTIYKACNAIGKTLVIDPYIAAILNEASRFAKIHHPGDRFRNIKVMFPYFLTNRMIKGHHEKLIYPLKNYKILRAEIDQDPGKYVMCIRSSLKFELERMKGIDGGNLVYSLWKGYLKQNYTNDFVSYLKDRNYSMHYIHTSGHADVSTLKEYADAINPKNIVPIHTFTGDEYSKIFKQPILKLKDKEIKLL